MDQVGSRNCTKFFLFNVGKDYKRLKYSMISEKEKSCAGYKNIKKLYQYNKSSKILRV